MIYVSYWQIPRDVFVPTDLLHLSNGLRPPYTLSHRPDAGSPFQGNFIVIVIVIVVIIIVIVFIAEVGLVVVSAATTAAASRTALSPIGEVLPPFEVTGVEEDEDEDAVANAVEKVGVSPRYHSLRRGRGRGVEQLSLASARDLTIGTI